MAAIRLLILGLAVFATPSEANKISTNSGIAADTTGFLGRFSGLKDSKENQDANRQVSFIKRTLVDDEGQSLGEHHGAFSAKVCQLACESTDGCNSFTFKEEEPENPENWCHLKDKCIDEKTPENKSIIFQSFYKKYIKMTWAVRSLVADEGNSVGNFQMRSIDKCKQKCNANPRCKSLSYGRDWCLLKDKCVTADAATARHGHVSDTQTYYMPCETSGSATWHHRSLVEVEGTKLAEATLTRRECEIKCDANPRCNSFSFMQKAGTCRLYDKAVTEDEPAGAQPSAYSTYYKPCGHMRLAASSIFTPAPKAL